MSNETFNCSSIICTIKICSYLLGISVTLFIDLKNVDFIHHLIGPSLFSTIVLAHLCLLKVHAKETGRWTKLCAFCEIVYCLCGLVCYNVISNDLRGPLYLDQIVDIVSIICSSVFWSLFIHRRGTSIYYKIKKNEIHRQHYKEILQHFVCIFGFILMIATSLSMTPYSILLKLTISQVMFVQICILSLIGYQTEPMIKLSNGKCLSKRSLIFLIIGYCTLFAHFIKCITAKPNLVGFNYPWDIVPLFSVSTCILQWIICIVAFSVLPIKGQREMIETQVNESLMTTECDSTNTAEESIAISVD